MTQGDPHNLSKRLKASNRKIKESQELSERDKELHTYAVITREAEGKIAELHDRMPVILKKEQEEKWLKGGLEKEEFRQYPDENLEVYPVTEKVNNPEVDNKQVVKRKKTLGDFK